MSEANIFDQMSVLVAKEIPGFSVRYKNESWLMKLFGLLAKPFNPTFMTGFITTLYPVVYFPDRAYVTRFPDRSAEILAHEFVHLWDAHRHRVTFTLGYMVPQILAVPLIALYLFLGSWIPGLALAATVPLVMLMGLISSVKVRQIGSIACLALGLGVYLGLAIWLSGWWAFLAAGALLPMGPWYAPFRAASEYRGYAMGIAWRYWLSHKVDEGYLGHVAANFTGFNYFRMDPKKSRVQNKLGKAVASCVSGDILRGEDNSPYKEIYEFLEFKGLIHV